ncbi:FtsX-like permease family protein [Pedobacter changchengzhani]|uniref:FtsX-like permease family protein n=1 Tax=Pedobacter changchengzhani TaxID=2529274 RepID=A0A4R5MP88_9SPHI|nr:ABC transporter permease [Pedobacter changchengzhani]TDG37622.1 FtsX-like permease family protein [Pedobacter changchengzhani]
MNTSFYIAKRYLFTKKSTNAINLISGISMVGVMVGSAALIIILTVFNGFEEVILKMFNTITPQLEITPATGKTFDPNTTYFLQLKNNKKVFSFTEVLQENALLKYNNKQAVGMVRGVSFDYLKNKGLDSTIREGHFMLHNKSGYNAVIGSALQGSLAVNTVDPFTELQIFSPKKTLAVNSINPADDFVIKSIPVSGVFEIQQEFDNGIIVPLDFARTLLGEDKAISLIEINLQPNENIDNFQQEVADKLGDKFEVRNRAEQNRSLYHILNTEKWAVYIILTFILIIAIFNIIGSLTMLVIDKVKDIAILSSLGASKRLIKRIFLLEGMMITMSGCILGLFLGFIFCILQQKYSLISMGEVNQSFLNAYPISLKAKDFVLVFITVGVFSFLASALSSNLSVKQIDNINQSL